MIRFKEQIFKDFFIDAETGVITDKNGVVQPTKIYHGRPCWKGRPIHRIQAYTAYGNYDSSVYDVHHNDENKMNNALSNLILLPHKLHGKITWTGRHHSKETRTKISAARKGGKLSEETKLKMSVSRKGHLGYTKGKQLQEEHKAKISATLKENQYFKGLLFWNNGIVTKRSKECPGPEWKRGRHKNHET